MVLINSYQQAHRTAQQRHQEKPKAVKLTEDIKRRISDAIICGDWSPEQVAGRLEKEGVIKLHHETIYQFIEEDKRNDGTLYKHLRHQKKTYRSAQKTGSVLAQLITGLEDQIVYSSAWQPGTIMVRRLLKPFLGKSR